MSETPAPEPAASKRPAPERAQAPETTPARRAHGPARGVALAALAVFGVAAVAYVVIPKSSGSQASAAKFSSAAVMSTPTSAAGTATGGQARTGKAMGGGAQAPAPSRVREGVAPVPVSGPRPLKPSDPALIKSWNAGRGGAALAQVTTQSGNVLMSHNSGQYPEMLRYCDALAGAVRGAKEVTPIPDAAMQEMYATSLNAFAQGATDCAAAITQHAKGIEDTETDVNHTVLDRAVSEFDAGVRDLYIATEVMRKQ